MQALVDFLTRYLCNSIKLKNMKRTISSGTELSQKNIRVPGRLNPFLDVIPNFTPFLAQQLFDLFRRLCTVIRCIEYVRAGKYRMHSADGVVGHPSPQIVHLAQVLLVALRSAALVLHEVLDVVPGKDESLLDIEQDDEVG